MIWVLAYSICKDEFCGKKRVLREAETENSRMGLSGEFERFVSY